MYKEIFGASHYTVYAEGANEQSMVWKSREGSRREAPMK
jgi:hypothetical protein